MNDKPRKTRLFFAAVLLCAALYSTADFWNRPFWYDEALTIMEYFALDNIWAIYRNYQIPNNHIVYTVSLLEWCRLLGTCFPLTETLFRCFSGALGAATVLAGFYGWRKRTLGAAAFPVFAAFALSLPFSVYGSAVRGYMLSSLLLTLAVGIAVRFKGKWRVGMAFGYGVIAFFAVGVMPSNLVAFLALSLAFFPRRLTVGNVARWTLFPLIPGIAFATFYAPIAGMFIAASAAAGGWADGVAAAVHYYGSFATLFLPLLLLAAYGAAGRFQKAPLPRKLAVTLVFLAPLAFFLAPRGQAIFPRALWAVWIPWLYLLALAVRDGLARWKYRRRTRTMTLLTLSFAVIVVWSAAVRWMAPVIGRALTPVGEQDDFIQPYFMAAFHPREMVAKLWEIREKKPLTVFIGPEADPPSLLIYGQHKEGAEDVLRFDAPRRRVDDPRNPGADFYVIVRDLQALNALKTRFQFQGADLVFDSGFQKLYRTK